jgi:hypothetical protein
VFWDNEVRVVVWKGQHPLVIEENKKPRSRLSANIFNHHFQLLLGEIVGAGGVGSYR